MLALSEVVAGRILSIKQVKAKQALTHLKLQQLKQKQELLRREEELKLKRQILEAQYEIQQADLQVELLHEPGAVFSYPPIVSEECGFAEEFIAGEPVITSKPKDIKSQVQWKPELKTETPLDPDAKEFSSFKPSEAFGKPSDYPLPGLDVLDRMASTIRQGFALPKPELTTFDGNRLDYWNFVKAFENSIERNASSESKKLMYLLQNTSGVVKETIKCCLVMDTLQGYQMARKLLEERFGLPFKIASEYVTKLTEGPPLKPSDRSGLLAFADQLKDCEHMLQSIGYLDEINSADNLRRIVQRLLFHLRTKFVEVADQIQQAGQRTNISHIAEFVKVKARAANNPVFGSEIGTAHDRMGYSRRRL